jgi:beta-phosphoglucomutase-like phosphatase (HAD superfamily)
MGVAGHEVVFVGDARRDADIARAAGVRFVGMVRAGHPDNLAGSGVKVVGSLSELADELIRARRSTVTGDAHERVSVTAPPVETVRSGIDAEALEVGPLMSPRQPGW